MILLAYRYIDQNNKKTVRNTSLTVVSSHALSALLRAFQTSLVIIRECTIRTEYRNSRLQRAVVSGWALHKFEYFTCTVVTSWAAYTLSATTIWLIGACRYTND